MTNDGPTEVAEVQFPMTKPAAGWWGAPSRAGSLDPLGWVPARRQLAFFDWHLQLVIGHWDLVIAPDNSRRPSRIIRVEGSDV